MGAPDHIILGSGTDALVRAFHAGTDLGGGSGCLPAGRL